MNINKRKMLGTIIGIIFFSICIIRLTYAYYSWQSEKTTVDITISDYKVEMTINKEINADKLGPILNHLNSEYYTEDNEGIFVSYADFSVDNPASYDYYMTTKLAISSISDSLKVESFKYSLIKENSTTAGIYDNIVCEGNFKKFDIGENLTCHNVVIPTGAVTNYRFVVYIDGSMYNSNDMMNSSLNSILNITAYRNYNLDTSGANEPNLVDGLIPVYYDNSSGNWKKADQNNANETYKWYNYDEKMWANAVLVSSTNRNVYKGAALGTTISMSDIIAFYVWIPRYKYRIWNITRKAGNESTYSYPAYTEGIDIEFEINRKSTGNVECTYNTATTESETNLSDSCIYNKTDIITAESSNSNYTDAWYTHPAFNFDGNSKSGFWVGKFETSGTSTEPLIKPDLKSNGAQKVSSQFNIQKIFQTYGLSSKLDAHMITNLEWGAITYFTYSNYGTCTTTSCHSPYVNDSLSYYTGRSCGKKNHSGLNAISSGTYSYDGYKMTDDTTKSTERDMTTLASTTKNIYGVYDMSGGRQEYVMGNMVDTTNNFFSALSGFNTLDKKYYNAYSNGTSSIDQTAFNRTRLGDATGEIKLDVDYSWYYSNSNIVENANAWFYRGGWAAATASSIFYFERDQGNGTTLTSRSVLI